MNENKDDNKKIESNNIFDNTELSILEKNEILKSISNVKIEQKEDSNNLEINNKEDESEFDTNYEKLNIPKDFPINLSNIELKKEKTEQEVIELSNTKIFINKVSNLFSNIYAKTTDSLSNNLEKASIVIKKNKTEKNILNTKFNNNNKKLNKKEINNNFINEDLNLEKYKNEEYFVKDGIIFIKDNILSLKKIQKNFPLNTLVYIICNKQFIIKGEDWWIAIPKNKDLLDIEFERFEIKLIENNELLKKEEENNDDK